MKYFTEKTLISTLLFVILFGGSFIVYWYFIDGVYINPLFEYTQQVNSKNIHLDRSIYDEKGIRTKEAVYRPGETPSILVSFCKYRHYKAQITWFLRNTETGRRIAYDPLPYKNTPLGCSPPGQKNLAPFPIREIDISVPDGEYEWIGVPSRITPDGREFISDNIQTETFLVKNIVLK
jgi:hypothetical protein